MESTGLNYKRKEIEEFIDKDLIHAVAKEFERYRTQSSKELLEKIEEMKKEIERLENDREVIESVIGDYNPDEVFINGDAFYPKGYKVIETEFKALMGA